MIIVYEENRKNVMGRLRFTQSRDSLQGRRLLLLVPVAWVWSPRLGQLSAASVLSEIQMWRESVKMKVTCGYNINRNVGCE